MWSVGSNPTTGSVKWWLNPNGAGHVCGTCFSEFDSRQPPMIKEGDRVTCPADIEGTVLWVDDEEFLAKIRWDDGTEQLVFAQFFNSLPL